MSCCKIDQTTAKELVETAQQLCSPGKGLLDLDESFGKMKTRFQTFGVESTDVSLYRSTLLTTPELSTYVSGVSLNEDAVSEGGELCKRSGLIFGVKVYSDFEPLPMSSGETVTVGLDGLSSRCRQYYESGARFAKWCAVMKISDNKCPSPLALQENCRDLARFAAIAQANRLVPVLEVKVVAEGEEDIDTCAFFTEKMLSHCFKALNDHHVVLEGCLLKPDMITHGVKCGKKCGAEDIAYYTLRTLQRTVPPALVGVTFRTGNQTEEEAAANLSALNKMSDTRKPWTLTHFYSRPLTNSFLKTWGGNSSNLKSAQSTFLESVQNMSNAQKGNYQPTAAAPKAVVTTTQVEQTKTVYTTVQPTEVSERMRVQGS